jgi:hypothetical protein
MDQEVEARVLRLRELLLPEKGEEADTNGELADQTDPEPGLGKSMAPATGEVRECGARTRAVDGVSQEVRCFDEK